MVECAAVAAVQAAQCATAVLTVGFAAAVLELEVAFLDNQAIAVEAAALVA